GPGRDGDGVDVLEPAAGRVQRGVEGGHEGLEVGPARHLRHDAPEARVLVHRRGRDVGEQLTAADEGEAGLVAARLDPEDQWFAHSHRVVRDDGTAAVAGLTPAAGMRTGAREVDLHMTTDVLQDSRVTLQRRLFHDARTTHL